MKHGDLIILNKFVNKYGYHRRRKAVVLQVTQKDIDSGIDALKPGLYAFHGFWYGKDPLSIKSYGKMVYPVGQVIGRAKKNSKVIKELD